MKIIIIESKENIEKVRFNDIIYTRYPQSKNFSDRNYYRCKIADKKNGHGALHRDIWKFHHGEIPESFHIHHKDGNALNNDISNLEALSPKEHREHHKPTPEQKRAISYIKTKEYALEKARKKAVKWHSSSEGRKWHSEHGKRLIAKRPLITKICEHCENEYQTISLSSKDRFCSNKCKAAWRRSQGLDNEQRNCKNCKKEFSVNKYSKINSCSLNCGAKLRWIARKEKSRNKFNQLPTY